MVRFISRGQYTEFLSSLDSTSFGEDEGEVIVLETDLLFGLAQGDNLTGVIRAEVFSGFVRQLHVALSKGSYGRGEEFMRYVLSFLFSRTPTLKAVAFIPSFNKLTIQLARKVGAQHEGTITKAFNKGWRMHDMLIFGLTKKEFNKGVTVCLQ